MFPHVRFVQPRGRTAALSRTRHARRILSVVTLITAIAAGLAGPAQAVPTAVGSRAARTAPAPADVPDPVPFAGLKPNIIGHAYLFPSTDGIYDKPVVIPGGLDPRERVRNLTIQELYELLSPFVEPARERGYDVWIFKTVSGQNIHEQAAEFAQSVNHAANQLGPNGQVIVAGYSLGGLVARIATARWEDPNEAGWRSQLGLRSALPVSAIAFGDAPLLGANVNLDLQKAVWRDFNRQRDFNLDSCGAQQLLRFSDGGFHPDLEPGQYIYARNYQKFFEEGAIVRFRGVYPYADDWDDAGNSICFEGPAVVSINGDGWAHGPRIVAFSDGTPAPMQCYGDSRDHNRRGESVCPRYQNQPFVPQVGDAMHRIHVPLRGDYDARAEAGDLEGGSRIGLILRPDECPLGCYGPEQYFTGTYIPISSSLPAGAPFAATRYNTFQGIHAYGYSHQVEWLLGQLDDGGGGGPCPPTAAPVPQGPAGNIASPRPTFRWSAVEGAETYTLYVQRVSDGSVVLQGSLIAGTSFRAPETLPAGVALRWKVKGECQGGRRAGPYSPQTHFTVTGGGGPCPPTAAPVPGPPSGAISNPRPTFTWSEVAGAETYTIYVQRVSNGEVVAQGQLIDGTSFTPASALPEGVDLRWKVKGECDGGRRAGTYSASTQFRVQTAAPPAVTITAPRNGAAVAGPTTVQASTSPTVTRADLFVDGVLHSSDTSAPFAFGWNPAANPLPAPNHPIDYGYFLVDGRYGDFRSEVNGYTNLYHAWARRGYEPHSGATDDEWLPLMQQALARAAAENRRIYLNLNLQEQAPGRITPVDRVLGIAAPYWNHIVRIELADEPNWDQAQTEAQVQAIRARLQAHALASRPMGIILDRPQSLASDAVFAPNLDFVVIEAYVDPPGDGNSQANIDAMMQAVTAAKNRIPAGKQIGLVMQAYARNGYWTDIDTLRDLQVPTYLLAYNDPRVVMISMFSYGRDSGTRRHPDLATAHRMIGERILGRPVPTAGDGRRTLAVKVYDAVGNSAMHRVNVRVDLSRRGDFVGDHKADITVFRPSNGTWYLLNPAIGPPLHYPWGQPGDIPVPGDYLGDGKLEPAVFRPSNSTWYIRDLATGETRVQQWGLAGDIPVVGDYLGDVRSDLTVFRPSTGTWYFLNLATGEHRVQQWGVAGDIPVAADVVDDGRSDPVVFRPSTGTWFLLNLATGQTSAQQWGASGDVPVAADILGDGRTDLTVFRPSTGTWYVRDANTGETAAHPWGATGDIPVGADYLGDGRSDLTVFRPSDGTWYLRDPNNGQTVTIPWGASGDIPVA
jgi:Bacterial Ig domain